VITAVDTSVLLDVFIADPTFGVRSREALRTCTREGRLVACDIVWAEVAASFPSEPSAHQALQRLGVEFSALEAATALAAGRAFKDYRRGGGTRQRVVADFLVGAHAQAHAERLLTRDRGFYRTYFKGIAILDPSAGSQERQRTPS
jgi:predicted nucleic acid-binding protein